MDLAGVASSKAVTRKILSAVDVNPAPEGVLANFILANVGKEGTTTWSRV